MQTRQPFSRRRLNYARVCIEIDAQSQLIEEFDLASGLHDDPCKDPIKIRVLYQWKPAKCAHCQVFGHASEACEATPNSMRNAEPQGKAVDISGSQPTQIWTRIDRKMKAGRNRGESSSHNS